MYDKVYGYDLNEALRDRGYTLEFDYGNYDYSWNETRVFTKDGRVFELTASGCSCYGFGDDWGTVDDAIGDMHEVTSLPDLTDAYFSDSSSHSSFADADSLREEYRKLGVR